MMQIAQRHLQNTLTALGYRFDVPNALSFVTYALRASPKSSHDRNQIRRQTIELMV